VRADPINIVIDISDPARQQQPITHRIENLKIGKFEKEIRRRNNREKRDADVLA